MLANAVSSAIDRLYAGGPIPVAKVQVQAVSATQRVEKVQPDTATLDRDEREQTQQRQALTRGVRAVFETSAMSELDPTASDSGDRDTAATPLDPDPQLEEAIMRFLHSLFRTLALAEGGPQEAAAGDGSTSGKASGSGSTPDRAIVVAGVSSSRAALGARIGALAQRYAQEPDWSATVAAQGDASTPRADVADMAEAAVNRANAAGAAGAAGAANASNAAGGASGSAEGGEETATESLASTDAELRRAFNEVLQALNGGNNSGGQQVSSGSRSELVNLMQRLALAMQGAPPVDPGLPTKGSLISTRA